MREEATAFAPACVGNVGVGFDVLGHTIAGPGDRARVRRIDHAGVRIDSIHGASATLPLAADANTAGAALIALRTGLGLPFGFALELHKGIPVGSGMGGSAASCVAALVAANALLPSPLAASELYRFAQQGESLASGGFNGDNVGPMLLGGLVLATPTRLVSLSVSAAWHCVLVHPDALLETRRSRAALEGSYRLEQLVSQSAHLGLLIAGCLQGDATLVREGLDDQLIEPRRAPLIAGFARVKQAALDAGAMGASISGAGPSVFAWFESESAARLAAPAMQAGFQHAGFASQAHVSPIAGPAAHLLD